MWERESERELVKERETGEVSSDILFREDDRVSVTDVGKVGGVMGKVWVQCTRVLDPLRCCRVSRFVQFLYAWQHLNGALDPSHSLEEWERLGSSAQQHWTR